MAEREGKLEGAAARRGGTHQLMLTETMAEV